MYNVLQPYTFNILFIECKDFIMKIKIYIFKYKYISQEAIASADRQEYADADDTLTVHHAFHRWWLYETHSSNLFALQLYERHSSSDQAKVHLHLELWRVAKLAFVESPKSVLVLEHFYHQMRHTVKSKIYSIN